MGLLDDAIREHLELKRRHGADPGDVARLEHEALGPARREPVDPAAAPAPEADAATGAVAVDETADDPSADLFDPAVPARYGEPVHEEPADDEPAPAANDDPALRAAPVAEAPSQEEDVEPPLRAAPPVDDEQPFGGESPTGGRQEHYGAVSMGDAPEAAEEPSAEEDVEPPLRAPPPVAEESAAEEDVEPPLRAAPPVAEEPVPLDSSGGADEDFGAVSMGDVPEGTDQPTVQFSPEELEEAGKEAEGDDVLEETPDFLQETPEHDRLWFEQKPPRDFEF